MKFHQKLVLPSVLVFALLLYYFCSTALANPLENWHMRHQIISPGGPIAFGLNGIAAGETLAVAVGSTGTFLTSQDGIQWTDRSSVEPDWHASVRPLDLAFGNNRFVAVGYGSMIAVSSDGVAWSTVSSGSSGPLSGVAFGNGIFVAVGLDGAVATSSDGIAWSPQPSPILENFRDVTFGNGIFAAVASGGKILTSPDGTSWTVRRSGNFWLKGVAFGNGLFMAAGAAGSEIWPLGRVALTSPDGIVWTVEVEVIEPALPLSALTFGNGVFVIAHGNRVLATPDGRTWQEASLDANILGIGFGNGQFIAANGSGTILSSVDGVSWTGRFSQMNSLSMVASGNGIFLVIGSGGTTLTSIDGIDWNLISPGRLQESLRDVTFGNGKFVGVGTNGLILTSVDGVTWLKQPSGTTNFLTAVVFGNGHFLAAGNGGTILVSDDATVWTRVPSGITTGEELTGVAFGNNTFVICGFSGTILSSQDGLSWTPVNVSTGLTGVTFGDGLFVAIGSSGANFTSPDALAWTMKAPEITDIVFTDVHHAMGIFVATGYSLRENRGVILSSADGTSWSANVVTASPALKGVGSFGNTFIALGDFETVLQSDPISELECIPDIRAVSSTNLFSAIPQANLSLAAAEPFSVKIGLWPMGAAGNPADWWVLAETSFGWYGYVYPDQWYPVLSLESARPAYQGPLFNLGSLPVLTISGLPSGRYTFYFGVDLLMNGTLDASPLFYDHVTVDVGASGL